MVMNMPTKTLDQIKRGAEARTKSTSRRKQGEQTSISHIKVRPGEWDIPKTQTSPDQEMLTSTQLSEMTEIPQQTINNLRKEGILEGKRPKNARSKGEGYLYSSQYVEMLRYAKKLGVGETLTQSARIVQNKDSIQNGVVSFINVLCALADVQAKMEVGDQSVVQNVSELKAAFATTIGNLYPNPFDFDAFEKGSIIDCLWGNFPDTGDSQKNAKKRRELVHAEAKLTEMIIVFIRFTFMQLESMQIPNSE